MDKISLIIPCKNEVESLSAVLEEIKDNKFVNEIIIVVDSELDNSIIVTILCDRGDRYLSKI